MSDMEEMQEAMKSRLKTEAMYNILQAERQKRRDAFRLKIVHTGLDLLDVLDDCLTLIQGETVGKTKQWVMETDPCKALRDKHNVPAYVGGVVQIYNYDNEVIHEGHIMGCEVDVDEYDWLIITTTDNDNLKWIYNNRIVYYDGSDEWNVIYTGDMYD